MLLHQQGSRVEVTKPQVFGGKIEEVSMFIIAAHLYLRIKITDKVATTQVAWVLSYVQGGVVEAWKDNLLDELAKGESEVDTVEKLFTKIRNDFGEMSEKERKIEQLWTIEQGERTCNEYVQEFKKVARGSSYAGRSLIEEFKRGLNGAVTNFIQPYLHQFFDDSHGLKASLKPSRRPFDRYQSRPEAINNGQDIRQINW